ADLGALRELSPGRRSAAARGDAPFASAAGRARLRRLRYAGDAMRNMPPERQLRSGRCAGSPALAFSTQRDGLAEQDAGRDLHADQGPRAQRWPVAATNFDARG